MARLISREDPDDDKDRGRDKFTGKFIQWSTDGTIFVPTGTTVPKLEPGFYEIAGNGGLGVHFEKMPIKTEALVKFEDSTSDRVISEIRTFWKRKDTFAKYGLPFKRGILLYGPPGGGKTSTVRFVMKDVTELFGGIVINFKTPGMFRRGMLLLRQIEPDRPVVVIMEDLDSILEQCSESSILNILDGVHRIENVVYLATTNYPEALGPRIVNRPSRFDKRFEIGNPSAKMRRRYLDSLFETMEPSERKVHDLDRWATETDDFSIAHLKELFTAVVILGDDYSEAIETLKGMSEKVSSERSGRGRFGFSSKKRPSRVIRRDDDEIPDEDLEQDDN